MSGRQRYSMRTNPLEGTQRRHHGGGAKGDVSLSQRSPSAASSGSVAPFGDSVTACGSTIFDVADCSLEPELPEEAVKQKESQFQAHSRSVSGGKAKGTKKKKKAPDGKPSRRSRSSTGASDKKKTPDRSPRRVKASPSPQRVPMAAPAVGLSNVKPPNATAGAKPEKRAQSVNRGGAAPTESMRDQSASGGRQRQLPPSRASSGSPAGEVAMRVPGISPPAADASASGGLRSLSSANNRSARSSHHSSAISARSPGKTKKLKKELAVKLAKEEVAARLFVDGEYAASLLQLEQQYARESLLPKTRQIHALHSELEQLRQLRAEEAAAARANISALVTAATNLIDSSAKVGKAAMEDTGLLGVCIPPAVDRAGKAPKESATVDTVEPTTESEPIGKVAESLTEIRATLDAAESKLAAGGCTGPTSQGGAARCHKPRPAAYVTSIAESLLPLNVPGERVSELELGEVKSITGFFGAPSRAAPVEHGVVCANLNDDVRTVCEDAQVAADAIALLVGRFTRGWRLTQAQLEEQARLLDSYATRVKTSDRIIKDSIMLQRQETKNAIVQCRELSAEVRERMARIELEAREALDRLIRETVDTTMAFQDDLEEVEVDAFFRGRRGEAGGGVNATDPKGTHIKSSSPSFACKREVIPSRYLSSVERSLVEQGKLLRDVRLKIVELHRSNAHLNSTVTGSVHSTSEPGLSGTEKRLVSHIPATIEGREEFSVLCHSALPPTFYEHLENVCDRDTLIRMIAALSLRPEACEVLVSLIDEHHSSLTRNPAEYLLELRRRFITKQLERVVGDVLSSSDSEKGGGGMLQSLLVGGSGGDPTVTPCTKVSEFLQLNTQTFEPTVSELSRDWERNSPPEMKQPTTSAVADRRNVSSAVQHLGITDVEIMWRVLQRCGYCQQDLLVSHDEWKQAVIEAVMQNAGAGHAQAPPGQLQLCDETPSTLPGEGRTFFDLAWIPDEIRKSQAATAPKHQGHKDASEEALNHYFPSQANAKASQVTAPTPPGVDSASPGTVSERSECGEAGAGTAAMVRMITSLRSRRSHIGGDATLRSIDHASSSDATGNGTNRGRKTAAGAAEVAASVGPTTTEHVFSIPLPSRPLLLRDADAWRVPCSRHDAKNWPDEHAIDFLKCSNPSTQVPHSSVVGSGRWTTHSPAAVTCGEYDSTASEGAVGGRTTLQLPQLPSRLLSSATATTAPVPTRRKILERVAQLAESQ